MWVEAPKSRLRDRWQRQHRTMSIDAGGDKHLGSDDDCEETEETLLLEESEGVTLGRMS